MRIRFGVRQLAAALAGTSLLVPSIGISAKLDIDAGEPPLSKIDLLRTGGI